MSSLESMKRFVPRHRKEEGALLPVRIAIRIKLEDVKKDMLKIDTESQTAYLDGFGLLNKSIHRTPASESPGSEHPGSLSSESLSTT